MNRTFLTLTLIIAAAGLPLSLGRPVAADAREAKPTPTPTNSRPRVLPGAPVSSPTPTPSGSPVFIPSNTPPPTPVPVTTPTLLDLQSSIRQRTFDPAVRHGRVGIKIVSLASGKVIFEQDSDKYFMPASNMKNFTIATAFERLGPNFKFVTSVYSAAPVETDGRVKGDLRVLGRGDVSFAPAFALNPTSPDVNFERLDALADKIAAAGVKRVEGGIVADESYFSGNAVPYTWEWDDLQWKDGAEVSAFPLNNTVVDLTVKGTSSGQPCAISIQAPATIYQVTNLCTTGGSKTAINVKKALDRNIVTITGTMPAGGTWANPVTVTHPAELFAAFLKERLERKGVRVEGPARVLPSGSKPVEQLEIARLESTPFSDVAGKTMKPSQNMYTETILWTMGEEIGRKAGGSGDSPDLGINVVKSFLQQAGIPADSVVQHDGSGMSRHDLVTPDSIVKLYTYMAKQSPNAVPWRNSLAVGGVDGTLRNRFKGTSASENFRGKTGTLDQVSALSGYVTTRSGEQVVLSIIVNGVPAIADRLRVIDGIVIDLANYSGRIEP